MNVDFLAYAVRVVMEGVDQWELDDDAEALIRQDVERSIEHLLTSAYPVRVNDVKVVDSVMFEIQWHTYVIVPGLYEPHPQGGAMWNTTVSYDGKMSTIIQIV